MSFKRAVTAFWLSGAVCILSLGFARSATPLAATPLLVVGNHFLYPPAPRSNQVDNYHGTLVPDPYRPLEHIDSARTKAWITAEDTITESYLAGIPERSRIYDHLRRIANYPKQSIPFHAGNHYFYYYNSGLQNQSVVYTMDGPHGKPRVLIDPNKLSPDGTTTIDVDLSPTGKYLDYMMHVGGSDWGTGRIRNVATGQDLPESTHSGVSWTHDETGYYYVRVTKPPAVSPANAPPPLRPTYYHRLGTPQSQDVFVYSNASDRKYSGFVQETRDGRYLMLFEFRENSLESRLSYEDLKAVHPHFVRLISKPETLFEFLDNEGPLFFLQTNLAAPNQRVIALDIRHPDKVRTIVPERSDALEQATVGGHRIFAQYVHDVHSLIKEYTYDGRFVRDVALPGAGVAFGASTPRILENGFQGERGDRVLYYAFENYTTPPSNYAFDAITGKSTLESKPEVDFDPSLYITQEVFYRSKDGTRVPLFISCRKGLQLDGQTPTILYGYGGFAVPVTPSFSTDVATWLQMGGIYAVANLRGGSEYGEAWHKAGMLHNKQHVFDDFIAAAEYLIAKHYTSTPKLAVKGESNGGLLVGAVETQRPDLFGAALPGVGVMDMLRYQDFAPGRIWEYEYGCAPCSAGDFKAMYAYSPYHNIRSNIVYPPTLITTADHDDRVFPAHSLKFAARLQAAQAGSAPILLHVEKNSAHGASSLGKNIGESADAFAFLVKNLEFAIRADFN